MWNRGGRTAPTKTSISYTFFGRYYNSGKINNGVAGGFDFGTEPVALSRNDATIDYPSSAPTGPGVNATNMAALWTGTLNVTSPGMYTFSFASDDGSMIYVDGQMVVANDFSQGTNERFGSIHLNTGFHPVIMKYAQGGGGAAARAFYNGPDTSSAKVILGTVAGSVTNDGAALFAPTSMDNPINVVANSDIDLAGANGTSSGALTFANNTGLRVTGVTGFETLTQSGAVTLNGNNTLTAGITLTNNQTNTHGHNSSGADLIISGDIGEAAAGSGFTKTGPRTVTLTGTNSFTGPVTVSEGRLVGNTTSLPTAVTTNATLEFDQAVSGTFANVISGSGSVVKSGAGTLSLNATNTYTGPTTVGAGTLTGSGSTVSAVTVNRTGAIAGASGNTFTIGGLLLNPDGAANFTLGAPSLTPLLSTAGSASANSGLVNFSDAGSLAAGTYRLVDYGGTALSTSQFAGFRTGSGPAGFFYGLVNNVTDTAIDLSVETPGASNTWTGAANGTWATGDSTNWTSTYQDGQQVTFADAAGARDISGTAVAPQRITVNSGAGNDYTIANPITGTLAGGLQKSGTSTLRLTGANTFTGEIEVTGGTLRADVSSSTSGLGSGAVTLAGGTTLQLDPVADTSTPGVTARYFTTAATAAATGPTSVNVWDFSLAMANGDPVVVQTDTNLDPPAYTDLAPPAGGAVGFDEGTANTNWKNFGIERTGKLNITAPGWYSFYTGSDDGTAIHINGRLVANADGGHGVIDGAGTTFLTAGLHDFRYEFLQGGGGADERIQWAGPGIARQTLPSSAIFAAESASAAGATNDVSLGTPIIASGNATVALSGTQFTGVQTGTLTTNGGTLTVTGESSKSVRASGTVLNDSLTISNVPTLALGKVSDLGAAAVVTKAGSGRLVLDHTAAGLDASTLGSGTLFDVQSGSLVAVGSTQAGATNPLGAASVRINGGTLELDTKGGTIAWSNPITVQQSGRLFLAAVGIQTTLANDIDVAAGQTLTLDVAGGARGSQGGFGSQSATTTAFINGAITGAGNLNVESTQTNGGQSHAAPSLIFTLTPTYTGLTSIDGFPHSQTQLELRGPATFHSTSGINEAGKIALTNTRLNLNNNAGGNLGDRLPNARPIEMAVSTIRFDGANTAAASETIGPITLKTGQNNLFAGQANGTIFATLTAASIDRENRSTLRLDGQNLGSLTATNGNRFIFTDSSGFNEIGGGGAAGTTNISIIPWVWGAPTGNNRSLVTYDAQGLRTLADAEYAPLATATATDNVRSTFNAATTIGSGAAQTINSFVPTNTGTADLTLTLAAGTVLNVTSGAVLLNTTDGTARRVTLAGGTIDFGSAEGVITASRRDHTVTTQLNGNNGITVSGDGQLTLNNSANAFSGLITVGGGRSPVTDIAQLNVQNDGSLGNVNNDVRLDGAGFRFAAAFTANANRTFTLDAASGTFDTGGGNGTVAGVVTGAGALYKVGGNTLTLSNTANDYAGETYLLNGSMVTTTGPQGDIHLFSSGNGTLTFDQAGAGTYGGDINGTGAVLKAGAGAVTFTGTHTYVGPTTVNAGALLVNGSINGSTTTVNAGTLGGTGSIAFDVAVGNSTGTADAELAPGSGGIGTLTAGRNVAFNSDAEFQLQINTDGGTTDLLSSSGAVTLGLGVVPLTVSDLGTATLQNNQVFTFITAANGVTGTFADLPDGAPLTIGNSEFSIQYSPNSVALVAVPEPTAVMSLLGGVAMLLGLRRRRRG